MKKNRMLTLWVCCMLVATAQSMASSKVFESSDLFNNLKEGEKAAILLVHFGTTHADTRAKTIDAVNQKAKEHFPDIEVREAYTSRIIIKRLGERGIVKLNPADALKKLQLEGFTHILIQPTTIINGVEMESLNKNVNELHTHFKELRVGTPLLLYFDDYEAIIHIITGSNNDPQTAYLWVGHGTYDVSTAQYAMLDYMLKEKGFANHIVGCIEGYPFYEQALKQLQATGLKRVKLIPFMFVAGEHAKNDIAVDWKEELESAGFEVEVSMQGLGEMEGIQNRFITTLQFYAKNRRLDIMDKKRIYETTGEKMKK